MPCRAPGLFLGVGEGDGDNGKFPWAAPLSQAGQVGARSAQVSLRSLMNSKSKQPRWPAKISKKA